MTQKNLSVPNDFVFQVEPAPSLNELFAASDAIGDKYLEPSEIQTRDRDLGQEIDAANAVIEALFPGI